MVMTNSMKTAQISQSFQSTHSASNWRPALTLSALMLWICGGLYSASLTSVAGLLFPQQATGSILQHNGKAVGSVQVAQPFTAATYLHSRPSSVGYDPMATGGSNMAPDNPALRERVAAESQRLTALYQVSAAELPVDLLASSGAGLDPHISPAAAQLQLARIAEARGQQLSVLQALLTKQTEQKQWGFFGQPRVNVLQFNLALDQQFPLAASQP